MSINCSDRLRGVVQGISAGVWDYSYKGPGFLGHEIEKLRGSKETGQWDLKSIDTTIPG